MAWKCTGATNTELIHNMASNKIINSERVIQAMTRVDRACYVRHPDTAYEDSPQPIGHGATISAPHMHAYAAENLLHFLKPGARVLDVGSGSGYTCAVFYQLLRIPEDQNNNKSAAESKVIGIEHIPALVEWSLGNLRKDGLGQGIDQRTITMIVGDGRNGFSEEGPYDVIHVGAAAPTVPVPLVEQLARPGRMFIPVGTDMQQVLQIDKDENGQVTETPLLDVRYVPLTDRHKQEHAAA